MWRPASGRDISISGEYVSRGEEVALIIVINQNVIQSPLIVSSNL